MQMTWDEFKKEIDSQLRKMGCGDAPIIRIDVVQPERTQVSLPRVTGTSKGIVIETDK